MLIMFSCVPSDGYFWPILLLLRRIELIWARELLENSLAKTLQSSDAKFSGPCICLIGTFSDRETLGS